MYRRFRSRHTLSSCPWAERQNLVYGFSVELASRQVGTCIPLSPSLGLSEEPKPPFEQISRNQHHHGKVLFTVPCRCVVRNTKDELVTVQMLCHVFPISKTTVFVEPR